MTDIIGVGNFMTVFGNLPWKIGHKKKGNRPDRTGSALNSPCKRTPTGLPIISCALNWNGTLQALCRSSQILRFWSQLKKSNAFHKINRSFFCSISSSIIGLLQIWISLNWHDSMLSLRLSQNEKCLKMKLRQDRIIDPWIYYIWLFQLTLWNYFSCGTAIEIKSRNDETEKETDHEDEHHQDKTRFRKLTAPGTNQQL